MGEELGRLLGSSEGEDEGVLVGAMDTVGVPVEGENDGASEKGVKVGELVKRLAGGEEIGAEEAPRGGTGVGVLTAEDLPMEAFPPSS